MTRRRTQIASVLVCLVIGLTGVSVIPASAAPSTGLTLADVRQQLADLQQQQTDLTTQMATSQEKLKVAQNQLDSTRSQITAQKAQMTQLASQLAQIALQQYQDRGLNTTALIMTSSTADDLLGSITIMQQVTDTANSMYTSLQLEQATLADLERSEQASVDSIASEQANLAQMQKDSQAKIAETTKLFNQMTAVAKATSLVGNSAVGAGVANPTTVVPSPSSAFISPVASYRLTDSFGMRIHPISGGYVFHEGIDMGASCGTQVRAPANGFVMDYFWGGGYGNRMVMDNGIINGHHMVTTYNHLSAGIASPGSSVSQGDLIALVGSTGASTGCHLHFEMYSDGQLVDPLPYIS